MNLDREMIKKIRGLIVFTAIMLIGLWNYTVVLEGLGFISRVIFPFVLGGAIAFVLNVPMHFIEERLFGSKKMKKNNLAKKFSRPASFLLTILFVLGIIGIVVFVVAPALGDTAMNLGRNIQVFLPQLQEWAENIFRDNEEIVTWISSMEFKWDEMIKSGIDFFKNGAGSVLGSTFEAAKSIVNGVTTFFIAFVFSCYILLQKEKLNVQVRKVMYAFMPKDWTEILLALSSLTYKTFSNFLTGQCVEAVILGSMFFVTLTILRMPYALLIGILIAFTALIPIFGAFIGCVIGAVLIFMVNPMQALIFVVVFLVLQQVEGNLIYPHVVGSSVGLPSIWVLVAVSLGASLMGVVGMLIFIPIASVVYTIFKGIVHRRLKEKNIEIE